MPRKSTSYKAVLLGAVAASALCAAATSAFAGGFEVREQSTHFQGMSFAGAAAGGSLGSMFWNSAAAIVAGPGITTESNYALLIPQSELTITSIGGAPIPAGTPGSTTDIDELAVVPASYAAIRTSPNTVFALGINSQFGLGTKPDNPGWLGSLHTGESKLFSVNLNPTVAHTIMPGVTVGAGLMIEYFDLKRLKSSVGGIGVAGPQSLLHGSDLGIGFTAGILLQPTSTTSIGLGYRSSIHHSLEGSAAAPQGAPTIPIEADVETPDKVTLSLTQALSSNFRAHATAEWTNWSRLGVIPVWVEGLPHIPGVTNVATLDFQWKDGWYFALGGEYDVNDKLTVRAGVAYEDSPINKATSRLLQLPDNDRIWASIGASYKWSASTTLDFAYSHVFVEDGDFLRVPAATAAPAIPIAGTADSSVDIISVGLRMRWGGAPEAAPMK